ncbi:extensin family protein [Pseudooctadecabacter sp.]|uniref:extensin-like domain-containing protein n=1 Tax=Pseudooctadecabacter sp. TaxID=1966338 RepID=UPI0035C836A3
MADLPPPDDEPKRPLVSSWAILRSVAFTLFTLLGIAVVGGSIFALTHPETPLPPQWNPLEPLEVDAPVTPLTTWKLRRTWNDPEMCLAALDEAARMTRRDPFEVSEECHIRNRVDLAGVGRARIDPIETSCATALRTAMWERHGVQPAAVNVFGSEVTVIRQIGSYNCRPIRTTQGGSTRWSTHATADAIDISGFDLADGTTIRLIRDWEGDDDAAQFLRAVRDSACTWFATTLGPDYNALHADHFHLQARGWGTCR